MRSSRHSHPLQMAAQACSIPNYQVLAMRPLLPGIPEALWAPARFQRLCSKLPGFLELARGGHKCLPRSVGPRWIHGLKIVEDAQIWEIGQKVPGVTGVTGIAPSRGLRTFLRPRKFDRRGGVPGGPIASRQALSPNFPEPPEPPGLLEPRRTNGRLNVLTNFRGLEPKSPEASQGAKQI